MQQTGIKGFRLFSIVAINFSIKLNKANGRHELTVKLLAQVPHVCKQRARNSNSLEKWLELGMQIVWFGGDFCNQPKVKANHYGLKPFGLIKLICYDPRKLISWIIIARCGRKKFSALVLAFLCFFGGEKKTSRSVC